MVLKNLYLYLVAFISGGSVLAIEILGTRVLGPYYGVSIFLWSALISVTLIALSVGYMIGGRWADRQTDMRQLWYVLSAAGIWTMLIPWLKYPVLHLSDALGLRIAVLIAAFFLFVPPLTLLGMISPYVIRLRAKSLSEVGKTAGDLYATSTIGSVVAALLTGFILIPVIGVNKLIMAIGSVLIVTASIGSFIFRDFVKQNKMPIVLFFLSCAAILLSGLSMNTVQHSENLLTVRQSPYAEIRVLDKNGLRHLLIDGGTHTIIDTASWTSTYSYTALFNLIRTHYKRPGELLLVGLGGGSIAKNFVRVGWNVDAVEIDPVVTAIAKEYFNFLPTDATIFHMDGRQYLQAVPKHYDFIILDAFGSSSIPFHLVTKEAFQLIADRLKPGGYIGMNIESLGWDSPLVRSLASTLKQCFNYVTVLPGYEDAMALGNLVFIAGSKPLQITDLPHINNPQLKNEHFWQLFGWQHRFIPDTSGAIILTDDLNPVDIWSESVNFQARKELHQYFEDDLSW
jgi:spermidine synthase